MIVPAQPANERERQAALERYDIVDSAPEADFDIVTQFIATICATPMAVISIVDAERQWFKSRVGLDAPQTPRDVSFCGHAILEPDRLMIVPDAAADERFAGNPLVTGDPHIRFYAGTPLVTSDGHALGTLCVLDVTARAMTAQQEETLRLAGRTVELLLEQRRRIAELEKITARQIRIEAELRAEIARRHAVEERLTFSSSHDGLTQLPNRTQFMSRLGNALERLHAGSGERFAVCFVDLDRFKQMNDTLGHLTGDTLLVDVGRRLSEVIRAGDAVARLGGDEFTLLIGGASTPASADAVAERIASVLRSKLHVRGVEIGITASVGVVLVDETYTSVEEIVRDADIAMYAAKARGRNRSVLFGPPLREEFVHARTVELSLRRALDQGQFHLGYQPIVALNAVDARPHGFEALLRLEQNGTLVSAAHFIDTAEQTGLIVELGYWVLREACAQAARWQGAAFEPIVTTVNVSAKQLSEPGFVQEVKRALHDYNIVPGLLALEVTESILIADVEASLAIMRELRELGLKIYLDDFGTGYSSLSYLGRFPVDCIKIDRSFVSGAGQGLADPLIVGSVISLAHQLGVEVVAEGVETERQRDELRRIGCDNAQGFLFSRAVPAAAALELITGPVASGA